MSSRLGQVPDILPVLSRGRHRSQRGGACFMEMASFLAGERWSDHPRCTHPLLGRLARLVNDYTSDVCRSELAILVPSVIGLTCEDVRVDARIALRCACVALPVVSAERQHIEAVSILSASRLLADLDGRPAASLDGRSRRALQQLPEAAQWAYRFTDKVGISTRGFRRHTAPSIVRGAVQGIAEAGIPDPDRLLRELLTGAIRDVAAVREDAAQSTARDAENVADRMPWRRLQGVARRRSTWPPAVRRIRRPVWQPTVWPTTIAPPPNKQQDATHRLA